LKTGRDFSKSTVIHVGEMLWELTVENSVRHLLKEMRADVKILHINNKNSYSILPWYRILCAVSSIGSDVSSRNSVLRWLGENVFHLSGCY
jgi:hypothetical protein